MQLLRNGGVKLAAAGATTIMPKRVAVTEVKSTVEVGPVTAGTRRNRKLGAGFYGDKQYQVRE